MEVSVTPERRAQTANSSTAEPLPQPVARAAVPPAPPPLMDQATAAPSVPSHPIVHPQLSHANATTVVATPAPTLAPPNSHEHLTQAPRRVVPARGRYGRPSSKFGTVNYSIDEMRRLNEKVRAVVPVAGEDWLHVAYQFNYMRPESIPYREVDSLKRKFKKMYCSRASVGGKLPDYVVEAKELRQLINQRSERVQIQLEQTNSDSQSDAEAQTGDEEGGNRSTDGDDATDPAEPIAGTIEASSSADAVNGEDTRDIAVRLQAMEDEYNRSVVMRQGVAVSALVPLADAPARSPHMSDPSLVSRLACMQSNGTVDPSMNSTSGIIQLLKQSIERKRRTTEELLLSESERVRKERKKRKMEQTLYNIHREHEQNGTATADAANHPEPTASVPPSSPGAGAYVLPPTVGAVSNDATSLGVMELVLQFMIAQQQETAQRVQEDEERRRREAEVREIRRKAKDAQRRRDTHELMLVMSALLQDSFPQELRHYLDPPEAHIETAVAEPSGQLVSKPPSVHGEDQSALL